METQDLTRQQLIDYFKDVFELEKQLYTHEKIQQEYEMILEVVGVPANLQLCHYDYEYREPQWRKIVFGMPSVLDTPIIFHEKIGYVEKPEWKETEEYKSIVKTTVKQPNILGRLLGCGTRTHYDYQLEDLEHYYIKCMGMEAIAIAQSEKPLREHIENEYNELVIKPKKELEILLNKLYAKNIIFPKYRNLAIIAQIYEYLASGRCEQLEGPYGAYNLFESELRQNVIIDRLDEIIHQLDRLNGTMNVICGAIQETNDLLGKIRSTLGRIEANTALTAYNSQCIAHNTRIASQYVL